MLSAGATLTAFATLESAAATQTAATGTRRLGSLEVSLIGLGCIAMAPGFYNPPPREEMVRLIRDAHEIGVTFYDTAEVYGPFVSKEIVGEALEPLRDEVVIATKFGFNYNGGAVVGRNGSPVPIRNSLRTSGSLATMASRKIVPS